MGVDFSTPYTHLAESESRRRGLLPLIAFLTAAYLLIVNETVRHAVATTVTQLIILGIGVLRY